LDASISLALVLFLFRNGKGGCTLGLLCLTGLGTGSLFGAEGGDALLHPLVSLSLAVPGAMSPMGRAIGDPERAKGSRLCHLKHTSCDRVFVTVTVAVTGAVVVTVTITTTVITTVPVIGAMTANWQLNA